MITIEAAEITRYETIGMIKLETRVITAWAETPEAGVLHGTQCDFPLGEGVTWDDVEAKVYALWQALVRAENRIDERYKEHHGL